MTPAPTSSGNPIPDTLHALVVPLDELTPYPRNPRQGDVEAIKRSLLTHGQYRPLVVNARTREVLAGNHTLLAARELGWHELAVTYVDVDDDEAARIVLVDNRSSDLAIYDDEALASLLSSLPDLDGTLWEGEELDALLASIDAPVEPLPLDEGTTGYSFDVYDEDAIVAAALAHYRAAGFPYPTLALHERMTQINALAAMPLQRLVTTHVAHRVADVYHPHRFDAHVGSQPNALDNFDVDEKLEQAVRHVLRYALTWSNFRNVLGLTHGAQVASNFRPGYALAMMRRYASEGGVVLDTSTGYGGRLVGFLASDLSEYVGIDPSTQTHEANAMLTAELCPTTKRVELHCLPAEDVEHDVVRGRCDFAITSPPYFRKERYADEPTQSWRRYPRAEDWREGFLRPMLALQAAALKPDAISIVNIADVTVERQRVPLVEWTLDLARDDFDVVTIDEYPLTSHRFGSQTSEVVSEPSLVLRRR